MEKFWERDELRQELEVRIRLARQTELRVSGVSPLDASFAVRLSWVSAVHARRVTLVELWELVVGERWGGRCLDPGCSGFGGEVGCPVEHGEGVS